MKSRNVSRLAWTIWAVSVAIGAGALVLGFAYHPEEPLYDYWFEASVSGPVFATLGALVASRRPGNVIGWIFFVPAISGGLQVLCGQYATDALNPGGLDLPGGTVVAWFSNLMQLFAVGTLLFLILLFPTGSLLSSRSRIIAWSGGAALTVGLLSVAMLPGRMENFASVDNPFGVTAASGLLKMSGSIAGGAALACFVAAVVNLILRYRRARGDERLQIKWFAYAAAIGFGLIIFGGESELLGSLVWTLGILGLPIAAGIAILRYRLYDIDRIINRTLVYGGLTLLLVLVYGAGVVGLGGALRSVFDQQDNNLAVAASTLAVAALFRPARARIQSFIDRRFYRSKYDAAQTLESFSARLRDEVDLNELTGDLLVVVRDTVQPAHASLWLRTPKVTG